MKKIAVINTSIITALLVLTGIIFSLKYAEKKKRDADRKACILNIRNVHRAIRSHHGLNDLDYGDVIEWSIIFNTSERDGYLDKPTCPHDGSPYILSKTIPNLGTAVMTCPNCEKLNHKPEDTKGW